MLSKADFISKYTDKPISFNNQQEISDIFIIFNNYGLCWPGQNEPIFEKSDLVRDLTGRFNRQYLVIRNHFRYNAVILHGSDMSMVEIKAQPIIEEYYA